MSFMTANLIYRDLLQELLSKLEVFEFCEKSKTIQHRNGPIRIVSGNTSRNEEAEKSFIDVILARDRTRIHLRTDEEAMTSEEAKSDDVISVLNTSKTGSTQPLMNTSVCTTKRTTKEAAPQNRKWSSMNANEEVVNSDVMSGVEAAYSKFVTNDVKAFQKHLVNRIPGEKFERRRHLLTVATLQVRKT